MTHNALSRSIEKVPMWVLQAVFGTLLSAGVAWTTWATVTANKHEAKIQVVETKVDALKSDISDIKDGQKEMNKKLDRLIERQSYRRYPEMEQPVGRGGNP